MRRKHCRIFSARDPFCIIVLDHTRHISLTRANETIVYCTNMGPKIQYIIYTVRKYELRVAQIHCISTTTTIPRLAMKWENEHDEFVARYVEQNPDDHVDLSAFFLFGYFKGRFDIDFIKRKIKIWRGEIDPLD